MTTPGGASARTFPLVPFPGSAPRSGIEAGLDRDGGRLRLTWTLADPAGEVLIPAMALPVRRDGLWQSTCFEAFIAPADRPDYLELNLAPSGAWNLYRFSACRQGMREVAEAPIEARELRRTATAFALAACLDLPPDLAAVPLEIGVTAVIEDRGGGKSYFALAHTGTRPDFHRRDSFVARL